MEYKIQYVRYNVRYDSMLYLFGNYIKYDGINYKLSFWKNRILFYRTVDTTNRSIYSIKVNGYKHYGI